MPDMPAITVKNISKQFDNVEVLRDINLTVKKAMVSIFGLLAQGNVDVVRCMNWLEQPDRGAIYRDERLGVDEHKMSDGNRQLAKMRERVGMVFPEF